MERARAFLAAVEGWARWFPVPFAVLYLVAFGLLAHSKPWSYDEIFVGHVIRLATFGDMMAALREGIDKVPPLSYVVTRAVVGTLGDGPVAYRAPSILAGLVTALCVFRFVSRRVPAVYAAAAMLFLFVTPVKGLAYEARPGVVAVAGIALALVCWQAAAEDRRRPLSVVGLAASLATAVGMHYYAALAVLPLALAEGVRTLDRRRVDGPVWLALGAAATPVLVFLPMLRGSMRPLGTFFAKASWEQTWEFYPWLVRAGIGSTSRNLLLVAAAGLALAWHLERRAVPLPRHEAVAAWGLALMPVAAAAFAMLTIGIYTTRYALPAVVGVAAVLAWTAARWWRGSVAVGLLLLVLVGAWVTVLTYRGLSGVRAEARARQRAVAMLEAHAADTRPIVVGHAFDFLHLSHDAPADLARRLVFLVDWQAVMQRHGHDTQERILTDLAHYIPLDLRAYRDFLASRQEFWLFAPLRRDAWIGPTLAREGSLRLLERSREEKGVLYLVAPRPTQ